jgi:hypothetical protein
VNSAISRISLSNTFIIAPLNGIRTRHMHGNINCTIVNSLLLEESCEIVPVIRTMIPRNENASVALSIVESLTL